MDVISSLENAEKPIPWLSFSNGGVPDIKQDRSSLLPESFRVVMNPCVHELMHDLARRLLRLHS